MSGNRRWVSREYCLLERMIRAGATDAEIGQAIDRSPAAVMTMACVLGIRRDPKRRTEG